jgi:subtilisin family serine protease
MLESLRLFALLPATLLALGVACSPGASPPTPSDRVITAESSKTVTLVTGDRVHLLTGPDGTTRVAVEHGPGREDVIFLKERRKGSRGVEIRVIPSDAVPFLAADRLDPRLFDVTALVRDGYDDAGRPTLPLIVTYDAARKAARAPLRAAKSAAALRSIDGEAIVADKRDAGRLWDWISDGGRAKSALAAQTGMSKIWLDGKARLLLDQSGPQIGAPRLREMGLTGAGVTVAVLDSGVKLDHPDFAGRIAESKDFTGVDPSGEDLAGHGTHVAGTVLGSGAASNGKYVGVAPGATLINGRVCDATGGCQESAIIAGMEWAAPRARIVNMSLGGGPTDGDDPMSRALNSLSAEHGTLFVAAAGNAGEIETVGTPAAADDALAVASVTKQDAMSPFSSRGPRLLDHATKPDVAAPGSDIVSARAPGTLAGDVGPIDDFYNQISGTSMATPHVAGAAALLAQQHPDWRARELKRALMSTAVVVDAGVYEQGAGRVDLVRAATQTVVAETPSLSLLSRWPHEAAALDGSITYRNDGDAAVTLELSFAARDAAGQPAPATMFTLGVRRVTVPAHGTASVAMTWNTSVGEIGVYSGHLVATDGAAVRVVVPIGAHKEPESYDLSISVIDRLGGAPLSAVAFLAHRDDFSSYLLPMSGGALVKHLPKGQYNLAVVAFSPDESDPMAEGAATLVTGPPIDLGAARAVTLDARPGQPVTAAALDRPSAISSITAVGLHFPQQDATLLTRDGKVIHVVPATNDQLTFTARFVLEDPAGTGTAPVYNLAFSETGATPANPTYGVRDAELLRKHNLFRAQGVSTTAALWNIVTSPFIDIDDAYVQPQPIPGARTEYFTAGTAVSWAHAVVVNGTGALSQGTTGEGMGDNNQAGDEPPVPYQPGEKTVEFNHAPLGPAWVQDSRNQRRGDELSLTLALFSPVDHAVPTILQPGIAGQLEIARNGNEPAVIDSLVDVVGQTAPEPSTFRLHTDVTRSVPWSGLGTRAEATWTFTSAHVDEAGGAVPLPLMVVRAAGDTDERGSAPGGQAFRLDLRVQRPGNAPGPEVTELGLEVSYDDGASWEPISIERDATGGTALLHHPAGGGFASLRMHARDAEGNDVTHTTLRSYAIRPAAPSAPDAGPAPEPDAGPRPDAGNPGSGDDGADGGCGCRAASGGADAGAALWLLGMIVLRIRRRAR